MYLAYVNNNKYTLCSVKYGLCLGKLMENIAPNNENWAKEAADFQSVKRAYKWMRTWIALSWLYSSPCQ